MLTGAGISAESGIPTFRDALTGLWSRFKPEQLATPEAFLADPKLVWDWYAWRRDMVHSVEPNAGHRALATLEADCAARGATFTLITQNVDGLHQQAGNRQVVELHGNIRRVKCFDHGHPAAEWTASESPPRCKVSLTVASIPSDAEVLLRVGQAPVDVERMPRGPRLEFVATAEGYAPKRTVIPKGAAWDAAAVAPPGVVRG